MSGRIECRKAVSMMQAVFFLLLECIMYVEWENDEYCRSWMVVQYGQSRWDIQHEDKTNKSHGT